MSGCFRLAWRDFWVLFFCMREHVYDLVSSAQDVNVLRLRWKHTVLSTLSKLSESKCIFVLRFKRKGRSGRTAISSRSADLACKVHWTLHAKSRFEGAWNALCNFKFCQSAHSSRFATLHPGCEVGIYSIVCVIIYYAKNMIIKFIQAKRDVTQMA